MDERKRKTISIRVDDPTAKARVVERLQAIAELRGSSVTALALQAIKEFVNREEGRTSNEEDLTRLLRSTSSLLGTMTDSLSVVKTQADSTEGRVAYLEKIADRHELAQSLYHKRVESTGLYLFNLLEKQNPNWPERDKAFRDLASNLEGTVRIPSLFPGGRGSDGAQG
jgi:hypothetical protein